MTTCPKCQGEAYLVDEEIVKVLENTDPIKIIAKGTYQCKSCGERFSRLMYENLEAKKKEEEPAESKASIRPTTENIDSLRFLDNI